MASLLRNIYIYIYIDLIMSLTLSLEMELSTIDHSTVQLVKSVDELSRFGDRNLDL